MKKLLFLFAFTLAFLTSNSQCVFQRCVGSTGTVTAIDQLTGSAYDMSTHTITWSSTLPGFVVNGNAINWASIGANIGTFGFSYTVTNGTGCDSIYSGCIEVIDAPIPTYASQALCNNATVGIPVSGGLPSGGTYSIGGTPITTIDASMIGQLVTYTYASTCGTQSVTAVVIGNPVPNPGAVGGP